MSASGLSVTSFAVQYSGASASKIAASGHDLIVVEAAPGYPVGTSDLTDTEVGTLVASGIEVIGYVSVGQTDDARPYWDPSWTDDGTDTGDPTFEAPAWMAEKAVSWPAAIVEFWDDDWQAIVMDQVMDMVDRGYSGIFLDNILSYYEIADLRGELGTAQSQFYAQEMMQFVVEIAEAARAVNPDFAVIANGGPFIIGDGAAFGTDLATDYLEAVDGIMAESFFGLLTGDRQEVTLDVYEDFWVAQGIDVLALEYSTDQAAIDAYAAEAVARGFSPTVSPTIALNTLPEPLVSVDPPETGLVLDGNGDPNELYGRDFDDILSGKGGADVMAGGAGNDTFFGGSGGDEMFGQDGNDKMNGGFGRDIIRGQAGQDHLRGNGGGDDIKGGNGNDRVIGNSGLDILNGGRGNDWIDGGSGSDDMHGGKGADTFVFNHKGNDTIRDFDLAEDALLITGDDAYSASNTKAGLRLKFDDGGSLLLEGLDRSDVDQIDFIV